MLHSYEKVSKKYGKIKDISDKDFFTNSMHCSVWKDLSPFEKIDIESQLTGYSSARLYHLCRIRRNRKKQFRCTRNFSKLCNGQRYSLFCS